MHKSLGYIVAFLIGAIFCFVLMRGVLSSKQQAHKAAADGWKKHSDSLGLVIDVQADTIAAAKERARASEGVAREALTNYRSVLRQLREGQAPMPVVLPEGVEEGDDTLPDGKLLCDVSFVSDCAFAIDTVIPASEAAADSLERALDDSGLLVMRQDEMIALWQMRYVAESSRADELDAALALSPGERGLWLALSARGFVAVPTGAGSVTFGAGPALRGGLGRTEASLGVGFLASERVNTYFAGTVTYDLLRTH